MTDSGGGIPMNSVTGKSTLLVLIASAVVVIGAFLDWISAGEFSESGIGNDGTITLILGIATAAAALFLKGRARMISVLVGGAIIVLVAIIDIADVSDVSDQLAGIVDVSVGIGLWFTLIGGIGALVGAFIKD